MGDSPPLVGGRAGEAAHDRSERCRPGGIGRGGSGSMAADPSCGVISLNPPGPEGSKGK